MCCCAENGRSSSRSCRTTRKSSSRSGAQPSFSLLQRRVSMVYVISMSLGRAVGWVTVKPHSTPAARWACLAGRGPKPGKDGSGWKRGQPRGQALQSTSPYTTGCVRGAMASESPMRRRRGRGGPAGSRTAAAGLSLPIGKHFTDQSYNALSHTALLSSNNGYEAEGDYSSDGNSRASSYGRRMMQREGYMSILPGNDGALPAQRRSWSTQASSGAGGSPVNVDHQEREGWPLKVMVFIDGTWLYYSMFGRGDRCPIAKRFGNRWHRKYTVLWEKLPIIIAEAVRQQLLVKQQQDRFVEVVRTNVFSSLRADTHTESVRHQMFRAMQNQNFDVHLATTVGLQEKCIDIALAVDMLHYSTVPQAYDMAVLITGDKDFMPAMSRTRQKGKRVCLVSMKNSCNRALSDPSAHIRDLDIIWLDDYLHQLLSENPGGRQQDSNGSGGTDSVLSDSMAESLVEFVAASIESKGGAMSSRDLGRELQALLVEGKSALNLIKKQAGTLRGFLEDYGQEEFEFRTKPGEYEFLVLLSDDSSSMMSAKIGLGAGGAGGAGGGGGGGVGDFPTGAALEGAAGGGRGVEGGIEGGRGGEIDEAMREEDLQALKALKVVSLKELLKAEGLPVTGKKGDLIERLMDRRQQQLQHEESEDEGGSEVGEGVDSSDEQAHSPPQAPQAQDPQERLKRVLATPGFSRIGGDVGGKRGGAGSGSSSLVSTSTTQTPSQNTRSAEVSKALFEMVEDYIGRVGGTVSSRDVGRFLANRSIPGSASTALVTLKKHFGGLNLFMQMHPTRFCCTMGQTTAEFFVRLVAEGEGAHTPAE